ncbi:hypothetical protein NA78x_006272 [Anatilimnocola sp. NA78]|uniref:hypothetical protein n=1 Tax=Anatilimnocola sp. NA78 TaxID=3415683 RepID=UPI003CE5AA0A
MPPPLLEQYAQEYAKSHEMSTSLELLGDGTDGAVWLTSDRTAIKVFHDRKQFEIEKECYIRLAAAKVKEARGFAIPQLVDCDGQRKIIEITTVRAPYLLDFGKCYLDHTPDFTSEQWAYMYSELQEIYEDRYDEVMSAVRSLQQYGIYYYDIKPKNVLPANWDPTV